MKNIIAIAGVIFTLGMSAGMLWSDAPGIVYYSGQLTGSDTGLSGTKNITLSIWDSATGGTTLFSETYSNLQVSSGVYTVPMGSLTNGGIPPSVFQTSPNRWLEADVAGSAQSPRVQIAAAPYALSVAGIHVVNGNYGLGTTTPNSTLDVAGGAHFKANPSYNTSLLLEDGNGTHQWDLAANTSGKFSIYDGATPLIIEPNTPTYTLYMAATGNIGIGDGAGSARLRVAGGDVALATQGSGIILKATDDANSCFRITVDHTGKLTPASVTCP